MMRFSKAILVAVVALAVTAYAFDCSAMTTPDEAMQCCSSMPCSPHGHQEQDCCKTMPSMHAPFVKSSSVHSVKPLVFQSAVPASGPDFVNSNSFVGRIAVNSPAPPGNHAFGLTPLRI
jgi:hypothetical protein